MKVSHLVFLLPAVFFMACGNGSTTSNQTGTTDGEETEATESVAQAVSLERDPRTIGPEKPASQYRIEENIYKIKASENLLYGYWVGAFGKNKINIAIAHIEGDSIHGHSVCAGNFRAIKGTINEVSDKVYEIIMTEPGDDQYDGKFEFTIDLNTEQLTGTWAPFKNTVAAKEYTLTKRTFAYDPNLGEHSYASTRYMNVPEVENLLPEEIEIIRNEIYARHGYSFQNLKIRRIFDAKEWYIPMSIDIREELTTIEATNIDLMYNFEEYYEEYYDSFGR